MSAIAKKLQQVDKKLNQRELVDVAYNFFVNATPEDSGNAKRRTTKQSTDTIFANYPYATRLDQGWSKQAPNGMSKPMFEEIRKHIKG
jgi:hypothetical protein